MDQLSLGVMARSLKEHERRLAIHPRHLGRIPEDLRGRVYLERGYGEQFGLSDDELAGSVAGFRSRDQLVEECDVILQPKPLLSDIAALRVGQVLWGWPHCVQDEELTQLAIDKQLTLIAFEAMNHWNRDGSFSLHVFHKNNELAGYCSVLHAMQIAGSTGDYGRRLRAVVIGFGATARGAVTALAALGVHDVDVLTHREVAAVASPIHSARIIHFDSDESAARVSHAVTEQGRVRVARFLAEHDIIVNCVLQDTDAPLMFMTDDDLAEMTPGTAGRRRLLRRGHGVQLGAAHLVHRAHLRGRRQRAPLRRRPQPVVPVELRDLGEQRGPAALPPHRAGRKQRLGRRPHHPSGHRDPRTGSSRTPPSSASRAARPCIPTGPSRPSPGWSLHPPLQVAGPPRCGTKCSGRAPDRVPGCEA